MAINQRAIEKLIERCISPTIQYFRQGHDEALYLLHRQLYIETKGRLNYYINGLISVIKPKKILQLQGDELLSSCKVDGMLAKMKQTGGYAYCKPDFSKKDLLSLVNKLDDCKTQGASSARSFIQDWSTLRAEPVVQQLVYDTSIRMVANEYLGCDAVLNMVTAWKTSYVHESIHNTSSDAMLFHFDADHNRFLKIFVYLTDVGPREGPHVFVPRTSSLYREQMPEGLQRDGRFSNIEVARLGLIPEIITASKGTLIFADTHCLHRGTRVAENHSRYILQLQFVDSVAGSSPIHTPEEIIEMNSPFSK